MKFYSLFFGEMLEMKDWTLVECKECYINSTKEWWIKNSKGHQFELCKTCSEEIEKLKVA